MSYQNWTTKKYQRERIDFFRFDMGYEDVFVMEDGSLLYACADDLGCHSMTASRVYAGTVSEWRDSIALEACPMCEEIDWLRSKEQTQADICWLYGLDRAPEDVAAEVCAWEYAFRNCTESQDGDFTAFCNLHDEAIKMTSLTRAAFTYDLPIAS